LKIIQSFFISSKKVSIEVDGFKSSHFPKNLISQRIYEEFFFTLYRLQKYSLVYHYFSQASSYIHGDLDFFSFLFFFLIYI
jgi:hypothetical protein